MTRWPPLRVPVLGGILVLSPSLAAAELECAGLRLAVDAELAERFPALADSVRAAFLARGDTDSCPQVELALREQDIEVRVALADGRSTVRSLARAEDVVPTLQALVIVPERGETTDTTRAASPAAPKVVPVNAASKRAETKSAPKTRSRARAQRAGEPGDTVEDRGVLAVEPEPAAPSALRIELSAAVGAHSGEEGRSSLNFGLQSLLDIQRFLAGFQVRLDQYQGGESGAFEIALLGGRRFDFGVVGLDLLLGPSLASLGDSSQDVRADTASRPPPPVEEDANAAYAFLATRVSFFPHSTLRPFVSGDAALRLDERTTLDPAPFPTWSAGVSVGATVGTL